MSDARPLSVPASRLSRFSKLGTMTAGVAGNMAVNGVAQLTKGQRPSMRGLLMTPANIRRVTDQLAKMRGAAMKVGQMVSMDTGEMLPPELADIMARLRDDAHFMPPAQLKKVLNAAWRDGWIKRFKHFDVRPIAAASIGQVHRATLKDGTELAIKVQYPGVAQSIDSDVANVGTLIKMSGLLPKGFELKPYLAEARAQLHDETDYALEAHHLQRFHTLLKDDARFMVPQVYPEFSTDTILAMSYIESRPIEEAAALPQEQRNKIATDLIDLLMQELCMFGAMQTDPNFANYRFDPVTQKVVLLDFGATRDIADDIAQHYKNLLRAGLAGNRNQMEDLAHQIGFVDDTVAEHHRAKIVDMMAMSFDALRASDTYDFADRRLSQYMQREGLALAEDGFVPPPLPVDVLFLQRKFGGVFLLAAKLGAKVEVTKTLLRYL
ncbi:AarF/ABC1/UbiB kinase family protein [Nereida sp. MMG025]|uniref:ABC1 kinase family protein n=1 Tax=Nereida sp. MMG025 TaxID=2909981 RepID=UPI001F32C52E|nr:AarF/ABC1/UbiB kinase family protein [Nereida sp. MMG025]MCF6445771.1 AarF/ABC1/UbiB kinase family protein [Nereida sp. MMG025]